MILPPEPIKEPPKYMPPVPKTWVSQGSSREIDESNFDERRPLVSLYKKKRIFFVSFVL
jgi:hypothetical protein